MMDDSLAYRAAERVRSRIGETPVVGLVLGSGLGDLADAAEDGVVIPTSEIEGYPVSTVAGHRGRLVFGRLENVPVVIVQGRVHLYEGHSVGQVTYPVRLVHALGARRLVLTNAAGGIRAPFVAGTLMLITDHINGAGASLTFSRARSLGSPRQVHVRSPGRPYSEAWLERIDEAALRSGLAVRRGTYVWVRGPSYETKAEIEAFRRIGADAVGMSTVPEAMQANALGMEVLGISAITNPAAGLTKFTLSHDDVLQAGRRVRGELEQLIRAVLRCL